MEPVIEEMNEDAGDADDALKASKNAIYSWKTLRMVARDSLPAFAAAVRKGGDLTVAARALYPNEVPPEPEPEPEPEPAAAAPEADADAGQQEGGEAEANADPAAEAHEVEPETGDEAMADAEEGAAEETVGVDEGEGGDREESDREQEEGEDGDGQGTCPVSADEEGEMAPSTDGGRGASQSLSQEAAGGSDEEGKMS